MNAAEAQSKSVMGNQPRIITLTTDFGSADGTVAAMIGVIKSISPDTEVVSVTSAIPAHDIARGAWALYQSVPFFPPGTIHIAVVDPGVGGDRRPILADTGREILIGPDNGVLSWAWRCRADVCFRVLSNRACCLSGPGVTFEGRDLFAPVAAHLACGADPGIMGPQIDDPIALDWPDPVCTEGRIAGQVIVEDAFGNLITNIPFSMVGGEFAETALRIALNGQPVGCVCRSYDEITETTGVVVNGTGLLEIAGNRRSAAATTEAGPGAPVIVTARGKRL